MQAYPLEIVQATGAAPSSGDIQRQEQSIRDRKASLDKREKELDEREKQIKEAEADMDKRFADAPEPGNTDAAPDAKNQPAPGAAPAGGPAPDAPKRGRPAQDKK
jgi:hypothetical protein